MWTWLDICQILIVPFFTWIIYIYLTGPFNFWKIRGVPGPKPTIFFGNFKDLSLAKISTQEFLNEQRDAFENETMYGVYGGRSPILIVQDGDSIKLVLVKNFQFFSDRGVKIHDKIDPLEQHLFNLKTKRWTPLRKKLSPVFAYSKLQHMFDLLLECADNFEQFLSNQVEKNLMIECRDITAKLTIDIIGVCIFGLRMNAIAEEDSNFRKFGKQFFQATWQKFFRIKIRENFPWLYSLLKPLYYEKEFNDFFINTITREINYRKNNNITKNDFIDLLIDVKNDPDGIGKLIFFSFFFSYNHS